MSPEAWEKAVKNNRLKGVVPEAKDLIKGLQPAFLPALKNPSALQVLDELCNENKHRTPLLTSLMSTLKPDDPLPFRHVEIEITRMLSGQLIPGERLVAFVAFEHIIVQRLGLMAVLDALAMYVGDDVLPLFDRFF